MKMIPVQVKAKRVSARANKGNREEDEDFETAPSFDKVPGFITHLLTLQCVLQCVVQIRER